MLLDAAVAGRPDPRWPGFHEVDGDESAVNPSGIRLDKGIAGRSLAETLKGRK